MGKNIAIAFGLIFLYLALWVGVVAFLVWLVVNIVKAVFTGG